MEKSISSVFTILKRRSFPALLMFAAVLGGAYAYISTAPKMYESAIRLMVDEKRGTSVSELGRNLTQVSNSPGNSPLANQAEVVKSERVLQKALEIASAKTSPETLNSITTKQLRRGLRVKVVPATNIIDLSYQSEDSQLAANLVNSVAMAMIRDHVQAISSEATKIREFLETKELPKARQALMVAEMEESAYRERTGIISFDEQTKSLVQSLAALEDQQRTLGTQLQEARSRGESIRRITDTSTLNNAYTTVRGGQDDELKKLRAKLAESETKLIEARLKFTESNPIVIQLSEERDALRNLYSQGLNRVSPDNQSIPDNNIADDQISQQLVSSLITSNIERAAIENKLTLVNASVSELRSRLNQLPAQQRPLTALTRKREETATSLKFLQDKLEEARIAEAQKVSNILIIDPAKPATIPASPKIAVVLALAIAIGIVSAIALIILLEMLDNKLHDQDETEELLQLPLLGVLPRLPAKATILQPANFFFNEISLVEPYRMLFKNLEFSTAENLHLFVVSSTISGEGKSIVTSHLGAISAMLSRRTLIIDADLRKPVQHKLFNLNPQPGIAEVFDGTKTLTQAIQPTEIENLWVLTCGDFYGSASQMLESAAMRHIITEASEHFDLVIIDTPPLTICADAITLGRITEGLLLVTRPKVTVKEMLQRTITELSRIQIPVLGVVMNEITSQNQKYYPYSNQASQSKRVDKRTVLRR
ncbi:GumC family protein [Calothrix sp. PCC 6303]|uniref:GumC family protein n=1 Tax=Calothrix sp. PCC 6303 TaxID=1170562 RepID=UPI0002A03AA6|nr:polysaccharide biosynthesis tyrosine autokinase [Calothrix sp. PCC 6303]AFZ00459.1 capsular exopolysaccharide family [Calothrix sp. PCC 6303]